MKPALQGHGDAIPSNLSGMRVKLRPMPGECQRHGIAKPKVEEPAPAGSGTLARISHRPSAAASDTGLSTALRFLGLLDILSSMPAGPFVARLVSTPVCAASRQNPVRKAG
jgi:hypothetical protein